MCYRAIETDASEGVALYGVSVAFAGLAVGEAVVAGLTGAASPSVSQGGARTLTGHGVAKVRPGSTRLAIAGWFTRKSNLTRHR